MGHLLVWYNKYQVKTTYYPGQEGYNGSGLDHSPESPVLIAHKKSKLLDKDIFQNCDGRKLCE